MNERSLLDRVMRDRSAIERDVVEVMDPPLPVVRDSAGVEEMFEDLSRGAEAIVVTDGSRPAGVLTRADLLEFLALTGQALTFPCRVAFNAYRGIEPISLLRLQCPQPVFNLKGGTANN